MRISDRSSDVCSSDLNLGTIKTDGLDVNVGWTLPEGDWGRLRFDWKNTFVGRYELVNESGAIEPRQPGVELNNSAIPEWTSTLVTDWRRGPWSVAWTVRHIDELTERSEEHTSELQSLMRQSNAVVVLTKKKHL